MCHNLYWWKSRVYFQLFIFLCSPATHSAVELFWSLVVTHGNIDKRTLGDVEFQWIVLRKTGFPSLFQLQIQFDTYCFLFQMFLVLFWRFNIPIMMAGLTDLSLCLSWRRNHICLSFGRSLVYFPVSKTDYVTKKSNRTQKDFFFNQELKLL